MKIKITLLWLVIMTSYLYAQSYNLMIILKDGGHKTVNTAAIRKMTFALDQTHALSISQKDSSQIETPVTNIDKITFSELTFVEEPQAQSEIGTRKFVLCQNYPNPFNSFTAINYQLSDFSHVEIVVYDILGQKIATLVHQDQITGCYKVDFNASELESGIYFCQLRVGEFMETKKMLFIK